MVEFTRVAHASRSHRRRPSLLIFTELHVFLPMGDLALFFGAVGRASTPEHRAQARRRLPAEASRRTSSSRLLEQGGSLCGVEVGRCRTRVATYGTYADGCSFVVLEIEEK